MATGAIRAVTTFLHITPREEGCILPFEPCDNLSVLRKCVDEGIVVDETNREIIDNLTSVGYARLGSKVVFNDKTKTIEVLTTARATDLGRRVARLSR